MGAVGHTFVAVFGFAWDIHFSPAGTGADNDRFTFEYRTIG